MKNINQMNFFMVGFPLVLMLTGWLCEGPMLFIGLLFTLATGGFQVIVGIGMFIDSRFRHPLITIYLIVTALFFLLCIFTSWQWIWAMPPALALYMSAILFIEAKNEKS